MSGQGNWATATTRIALVGDSSLDNVLWVSGPKSQSISQQITTAIGSAGAVANYAADGFTSGDTLNGNSRVISVAMRKRFGDPIQYDMDGVFRPLNRIKKLEPPPTHIVISCGGNDVREILSDMGKIGSVVEGFKENYPKIVDACLAVTPNVIIMLQYRPSFHMDGGGYGVYQAIGGMPGPGDTVLKLNHLMENIYKPVMTLAREKELAIIDLPRTFDIYDDSLYTHQIEPSEIGGSNIAQMIAHAAASHNEESDDRRSLFYLMDKSGEIHMEPNVGEAWTIPHNAEEVPGGEERNFSDHEHKVMALAGMGFSRKGPLGAEKALEDYGGSLQDAADALLRITASPGPP